MTLYIIFSKGNVLLCVASAVFCLALLSNQFSSLVFCWKAYRILAEKKPSEAIKAAFEPYAMLKGAKYDKALSEGTIERLKEAYRHPCESKFRDPEYCWELSVDCKALAPASIPVRIKRISLKVQALAIRGVIRRVRI